MPRLTLAFALVAAALLATSGVALAKHTNKRNPDPCPEPVEVVDGLASEQDAVQYLLDRGYVPSPTIPGMVLQSGVSVMENDYTKPVKVRGHAFGAYRLHAHVFQEEDGAWNATVQGPEPSPYGKMSEFSKAPTAKLRKAMGTAYVHWWHRVWPDAKPFDDGGPGC